MRSGITSRPTRPTKRIHASRSSPLPTLPRRWSPCSPVRSMCRCTTFSSGRPNNRPGSIVPPEDGHDILDRHHREQIVLPEIDGDRVAGMEAHFVGVFNREVGSGSLLPPTFKNRPGQHRADLGARQARRVILHAWPVRQVRRKASEHLATEQAIDAAGWIHNQAATLPSWSAPRPRSFSTSATLRRRTRPGRRGPSMRWTVRGLGPAFLRP